MWVDVTAQFGGKWANFFTTLELHYGLDINNTHHLWLLHFLFMSDINADTSFFAQSWNQHKIKIKGQASRSPHDLFLFDMVTNGVRGDLMSESDIATFGIDWEALPGATAPEDPHSASWTGRAGPPEEMNEVTVVPPSADGLSILQIEELCRFLGASFYAFDEPSRINRWISALAFARSQNPVFS